jgi:hypothetical protein
MKKLLLFLLVATLGCGNVYSQTKKPVRRTTSVAAKQKAEAEAKAKAEAEAKAKAEAEAIAKAQAEAQAKAAEAARIEKNNAECKFGFDYRGLYSKQNPSNDFVIYEIPNMSASDLKAATLSAISSLFKSPKDVVTNLGDNIIQLERYASGVYYTKTKSDIYPCDMSYSLIIQFKDGKVRYNIPSVKQIWVTDVPMLGKLKLDASLPLTSHVEEDGQRAMVVSEFNNMLDAINRKIKSANDW